MSTHIFTNEEIGKLSKNSWVLKCSEKSITYTYDFKKQSLEQHSQIGIFSDVHDNLDNLKKALETYKSRNIKELIFCGDFCSPIPSRVMGGFEGTVHCVFGNGDGDRYTIAKFANTEFNNLKLYGEHAELEFDGVKIAATHYPLYGKALARTGDYKAVFSGHTHVLSKEIINGCIWLNPGDVMGWKGKATCAIYDTATSDIEIIEL